MGLRDNFRQAARELLPGGAGEEAPRPQSTTAGTGDGYIPMDELEDLGRPSIERPTAAVPTAAVPTAAVPTAAVPTAAVPTAAVPTAPHMPAPHQESRMYPDPGYPPREEPPTGQHQRTLIAANTTIQGSIQGADGVDIYGEWIGDIEIKDDLNLFGKLDGNASGREAILCQGRVRGDLSMTGHIRLDKASMVLGNIKAGSLDLGGKVKGDLEIKGSLILDSEAVVLGNVTASNLSIAEGAVVQGRVLITSSKDTEKLFQEFGPAPTPRPATRSTARSAAPKEPPEPKVEE